MTTREYRVVLVAVVGLMIVAMVFVWSNVRLVGLAYEYQALDKTKRSLLRENHLLRCGVGKLAFVRSCSTIGKK